MPHAGRRISGRFDDDVHALGGDQRVGVVEKDRPATPSRLVERCDADGFIWPSDTLDRLASAVNIEIGDPDDVEPWRSRRLRQEHRAELAGPDHADPDRLSGLGQRGEFRSHAHAGPLQGLTSVV
jgi:hypothetical protein